jgi:hypothetical protein
MRKGLAIAALALLAPAHSGAEPAPKRDILGFYPGMSYAQAMNAAAGVCKGERDMSSPEIPSQGFSSIFIKCPAGVSQEFLPANPKLKYEESLLLTFAADLPDQPLSSVMYSFASAAPDQELIHELTSQFKLPPTCEKTAGDSVCFRDERQFAMQTPLAPQGWSLSYHRRTGMPHGLLLYDPQITSAENAAGMERAKTGALAPTLGAKP